ncbi:uncharacterized protein METZ01_LOCUS229639, partial [marine metagenome]
TYNGGHFGSDSFKRLDFSSKHGDQIKYIVGGLYA